MTGTPPVASAAAQGVLTENVRMNARNVEATYVNFCRVTGTPEEIVIDFALMSDGAGDRREPLIAPQRISLGLHTAKRLLNVLRLTLDHHERTFGVVETDVEKRLFPRPG